LITDYIHQYTLKYINTKGAALITAIDSIMGSGKTNYAIDFMNSFYDSRSHVAAGEMLPGILVDPQQHRKFIYVTPLLSEIERITSQCPLLGFCQPQAVDGRKSAHLVELIRKRQNIATTHALFSMMSEDAYTALKGSGYTLIMDEALSCVEEHPITRSDAALLK
jgi:hypothetical protein